MSSGLLRPQRLEVDPAAAGIDRARPDYDRVGPAGAGGDTLGPLLGAAIDGQAARAAVEGQVHQAHAVTDVEDAAVAVAGARVLDFDHLGAELAQQVRGQRAGQMGREVDDANEGLFGACVVAIMLIIIFVRNYGNPTSGARAARPQSR